MASGAQKGEPLAVVARHRQADGRRGGEAVSVDIGDKLKSVHRSPI